MTTTSYEALGRRADLAAGNVAKARQTVLNFGDPDEACAQLQVQWKNQNWDNGLIELGNALRAVVISRIEELLPAALELLAKEAADTAQAMRDAMMGGVMPGLQERAVPRALSGTLDATKLHVETPDPREVPKAQHLNRMTPAEPLQASTGNTMTGPGPDLVIDRLSILDNPVRELLEWVKVNPGKRMAKTPERTKLESLGYLRSTGTPPNNSWDLTDLGAEVLAGPYEERRGE